MELAPALPYAAAYDQSYYAAAPMTPTHQQQQDGVLVATPDCPYEKVLDASTGQFFYRHLISGEVTWDTPANMQVPIAPLSPAREEELRREAEEYRALKDRDRRMFSELVKRRHDDLVHDANVRKRDEGRGEAERLKKIWDDAVEGAKQDGRVALTWRRMGYVREDVMDFKARYGRPLVSLRLVGHGLETVPDDLCRKLTSLTSLHLPNNQLACLPDSIGCLTNLTELNLLRNQLVTLPMSVGDLIKMENLMISDNHLSELPPAIGNMTKLQLLNLDCNRLTKLPDSLKRMMCTQLSINKNKLTLLPSCIKYMAYLKTLNVNDNQLRYLPNNIGESHSITALHAISNQLMELPDSLGMMEQLEELWLDNNRLTALPMTFLYLTRLKDLRLDGNVDMIYPSLEVIGKGIPTILKWCALRKRNSKLARQRAIMSCFLDVLNQVYDNDLAHPGLLAGGIEQGGNQWFAVPDLSLVWHDFFPKVEEYWQTEKGRKEVVNTFPYQFDEVIHTLHEFRDADGPLLSTGHAMFRRCMCTDADGRPRRCVPPRVGFQCSREATFIKMRVVLTAQVEERRKTEMEAAMIETSVQAARRAATEYCDDKNVRVKFRIMAERKAPKILKDRAMARERRVRSELNEKKKQAYLTKLNEDFKAIRERREKTFEAMMSEKEALVKEWDEAVGWSKDLLVKRIELLLDRMERLPEDDDFDDLRGKRATTFQAMDEEVEAMARKKRRSWRELIASEEEIVIQEVMAEMRKKKIEKEAAKALAKAKEEHRRMRKIMASWAGLGVRECFCLWRDWASSGKYRRAMDTYLAAKEKKRDWEAAMIGLTMAEWKLAHWKKEWDMYQDRDYWVDTTSGETRLTEPKLLDFMPKDYVPPAPLDEETVAILTAGPPKADEMRKKAAQDEKEKEDAEGGGDDEDDEDEDEDEDSEEEEEAKLLAAISSDSYGDEDEDEQEQELQRRRKANEAAKKRAGGIPMPQSLITAIVAKPGNQEDDEDGDGNNRPPLLLMGEAKEEVDPAEEAAKYLQMVPVETRDRAIQLYQDQVTRFDESVVEVRRQQKQELTNAEQSLEEVRQRLHKQMRRRVKCKDGQAMTEEDERVAEREVLAKAVGFDPSQAYSMDEMQEIAEKAIAFNKSRGVTENMGVGARVDDDEFWHSEYDLQDWMGDKLTSAAKTFRKKLEEQQEKAKAKQRKAQGALLRTLY